MQRLPQKQARKPFENILNSQSKKLCFVPKRCFEKFKKICVAKRRLPIFSTGLKAQRKPKNEILNFTLDNPKETILTVSEVFSEK